MKTVCFLALAALAGCAWTPQELRQDGVRVRTETSLEPEAAARCLQRALENQTARHILRTTPLAGGAYEVLVRIEPDPLFPSTFTGAQMLFELRRNIAQRTTINAWFTRWIDNTTPEGVQGLLRGC